MRQRLRRKYRTATYPIARGHGVGLPVFAQAIVEDGDDGRHVVIRPLAYCAESNIAQYAEKREFPIIPCNLCGSQENMQRKKIKAMLSNWERDDPGRSTRLFRSLQNVSLSHLADRELFDFAGLGEEEP